MNFQCKVISTLVVLLCATVCVSASDIDNAIKNNDLKKVQVLLKKEADLLNKKSESGMTPLCYAALEGRYKIVDFLINAGADVSIGDNENSQPIHNAAVGGHLDVVKRLMKAGACPETGDDNGVTALHFALNYKRPLVADFLIDHVKDLEIKNNNGWTALLYAVIGSDVKAVKKLLARGAEPTVKTTDGFIPLHSAASFGNIEIVKMLVDHGSNIHEKDGSGQTPLFWALNPNCLEVVRLFIEKGADVKLRNEHGQLALHDVCRRGSVSIAKLHLEHGAELNASDKNGWTPLVCASAAQQRSTEMVKFLLARGAEVNPTMPDDATYFLTPLHGAIRGNNMDSFKMLVGKGANIDAMNTQGLTPMIMAIAMGHEEIVHCLLDEGCDLDKGETFLGRTALHVAAIKGRDQDTGLLIKHGADVTRKDKNNMTPLDYAVYHGFNAVAQTLVENGADKTKMKGMKKCMGLVHKPLNEKEAIIWHLEHSAWAIKTANHMLVFDYAPRPGRPVPKGASLASGYVCPCEMKDQNLCVFASHVHGDHYSEDIFKWAEYVNDIEYVMGFRPIGISNKKYTYVAPRTKNKVDGMKITTIKANDLGVGFLVEVDGLNIFHTGDHANRNADLSGDFTPEIDFLADLGVDIDVAFFPISGCGFGDPVNVRKGVHYAMKKLNPHILFPMHAGESTYKYQDFADITAEEKIPVKVGCAVNKGDRFFYTKKADKPISMK